MSSTIWNATKATAIAAILSEITTNFVGTDAELLGDGVIRLRHERQAALRGNDQGTVDGVDHSLASSFISTKNSRSLGKA